jgi:glc operon protein GlcG
MRLFRRPLSRAFVIGTVLLWAAGTALAQAPATTPLAYPPPQLTLAEARAIIEGAIAYARESDMRMAVAVVDHAGNVVSSDRMDGAALQNIRFAEGKAFASALYRQTTQALGELYKT